jgi:HEAT repeat protein
MEMLTEGGALRDATRAFLALSEAETADRETNAEKIQAIVEKVVEGGDGQWKAILELCRIGEAAVPMMVPYLKNSDSAADNIRFALVRMSGGAVLPLLASLKSRHGNIQRNVIAVLAEIGDRRSIPDLQWLAEKATGSVSSMARDAAGKVYSPVTLGSAKVEFVRRAYEFYLASLDYIRRPGAKWQIWNWKEDQLQGEEVPSYLYNYKIAEQSCYDALRVDPTYQEAWSLLVRIYFAQYIKAKDVVANAELNQLDKEQVDNYRKIFTDLESARVLATAAGIDNMMLALQKSLEDQDSEVGAMCLDALSGVCTEKNLTANNPIYQALASPNKRFKYAAAMAIVKINPRQSFPNDNLVVPVLVGALGESDARTILVVDNDADVRNRFLTILNNKNYAAFGASSGLEALERAKSFPTEDLIILDSSLERLDWYEQPDKGQKRNKKDEALPAVKYIFDNLRTDFRTRQVPIIITSDAKNWKRDQTLFGEEATLVQKEISEAALLSILNEVLNEKEREDYRTEARTISQKAAESLAAIDPARTSLNLREASTGLSGVLASRPDVIRAPAIRALGHIGDPTAILPLIKVFRDAQANSLVRTAAAWSLGEILEKSGTIDPNAYEALKEGLSDWDDAVKIAAGEAIGKAGLSGENRYLVFNEERYKPDREKPFIDTTQKAPKGTKTEDPKKEGDDDDDDGVFSGFDDGESEESENSEEEKNDFEDF